MAPTNNQREFVNLFQLRSQDNLHAPFEQIDVFKPFKVDNINERSLEVAVTYPEGFSYQFAGMGAKFKHPQKGNILLFIVIFPITGCFFLLNQCKFCFQVRKHCKPS